MIISAAVFGIIFITINLFMKHNSYQETERFLHMISDSDGKFMNSSVNNKNSKQKPNISPDFSRKPEDERSIRFFYAKVDNDENLIEIELNKIYPLTEDEALTLVKSVLDKNDESGINANMQYVVSEKNYGKIIVMAERSIQSNFLTNLTQVSFWVALSSFIFIFLLSLFLSKWIVTPVKIAFAKQKRFISDASHELKTPLAILSTNIDVLENEIGKNNGITAVKEQIQRMDCLIKDLILLAKTDENHTLLTKTNFDLSHAILKTTLEFESFSFEQGRNLIYDIDDSCFYIGNEEKIKQLISILIDNAIKHSASKSDVNISLKKQNGKSYFKIVNFGETISNSECEKVFERFYRTDNSRSRSTGGYGLGLSIAKSIANAHKLQINLSSENNKVIFRVYFPV